MNYIDYLSIFYVICIYIIINVRLYKEIWAQGHLARKSFAGKFSNSIHGRRGGFLSYWNHQLIKRRSDSDFTNNFVIIKNER